jgi:hypothetical protein
VQLLGNLGAKEGLTCLWICKLACMTVLKHEYCCMTWQSDESGKMCWWLCACTMLCVRWKAVWRLGVGGLSSKTSWERDWQQTPATKTTTTTTRRALAIWGKLSLFYMFGSGLYGHRLLLDLEKKKLDSTESVKIACALQCMHDPLKPTRMVVTIIRDHWNAE